MSKFRTQFTIVQHSACGYRGDPLWSRAVETRTVNTASEARKVNAAGGMLFDTYHEAAIFEDRINTDGPGMYPAVKGAFSTEMIDDLRIYIPVRSVVG